MKKLNSKWISKEQLGTIGKKLYRGCGYAVKGLATVVAYMSVTGLLEDLRYCGPVGYSDAVNAIIDSSLYSDGKAKIMAVLKTDGDSDYYKAVIKVVQSVMYSDKKVEIIENMSK